MIVYGYCPFGFARESVAVDWNDFCDRKGTIDDVDECSLGEMNIHVAQ